MNQDFLQRLRAANIARDAEYRAKTNGQPLPLLFRTTEFAGEVGELLNVVKKIERERLGWAGKRASREMLMGEFGGVGATFDLLAMSLDVDLAEAIAAEFNAVSDRLSLTTRLEASTEVERPVDASQALDWQGPGPITGVQYAETTVARYKCFQGHDRGWYWEAWHLGNPSGRILQARTESEAEAKAFAFADYAVRFRRPVPPVATPHPDDEAVDRWAAAMKAKLATARAKGRGGWDDPMRCSPEQLTLMLREHVEKGDPLDVANFAMMIHQRGLRILPPSRWADDCIAKSVEVLEIHADDELDRIENWAGYAEAVACVLGELQNRLRQDIHRPDRFRHLKTGGIYEVLGTAQIQASPDQPLVDYDRVVIYRATYRGDRPYVGGELRGDTWVRRETEFLDGRFEPVAGDAE